MCTSVASRFEGLRSVPERSVRTEVESYEGKRYSPSRLERLESAVYALNVFETVNVSKSERPRDGFVDLVVEVRETHPQLIKVGVGLGLEPNRWEQYGEVRYRHANLFKTMTSLDARLRVGYAELPALYLPREHGPIARLDPKLRKKGFLEKNLVWTLGPGIELGIQEGYQFYAPTNRAGVSRFFTRFLELGLSHNTRYVDFFNTDPTIDRSRSILGLDYRDPYLLSFIELEARIRLTDRLVDPTQWRGARSTLRPRRWDLRRNVRLPAGHARDHRALDSPRRASAVRRSRSGRLHLPIR